MNKLIYANFSRLKKSCSFWLCMAFMPIVGLFVALKSDVALDRVFFFYTLINSLASAIFIGLFIGIEHSDGTMRNKLIVGHTKVKVYLSNLLVCTVSGFAFCAAFILPMLAIGIPRLGFFEMGALPALILFGISLVLSMAFSALFTLIAMLGSGKAATAVACILCFIALTLLASKLNSALQEPEFVNNYAMSIDGVVETEGTPNPAYLSGTKRTVYQFFLDLIPSGQVFQFADMNMVHPELLPVYSLLIFVLSTIIGALIFRKKDIR